MGDHSNQSWYHGKINREQTESILIGRNPGTFLVRDSKSLVGDYVLSVSESGKVSHYIINHKGTYYQIGDQTFQTLPEIIEFYKKYLLDKTTLKEAVEKAEQLRAMFNFESQDPEDLPFKKGDTLTLVKKVEENWWKAKNDNGREGMIPKNYVQMISQDSASSEPLPTASSLNRQGSRHSNPEDRSHLSNLPLQNSGRHSSPGIPQDKSKIVVRSAPQNDGFEYAVAQMDHIKVYDDDLLSFSKGDIIKIIKKHEDGLWFGEAKNKTGKFSFTYVRLLPQNEQNGL